METIITVAGAILLAAITALLLGRRGVRELALRLLPSLILEAEAAFGAQKGHEKLREVLSRFRAALPPLLRPLFAEERVRAWVEELITAMRAVGELHAVKEDCHEAA